MVTMAFQQTPAPGPSQNIQAKLDEVERIIGRLSFRVGKEALRILPNLDEAYERLQALQGQTNAPRAEQAQFEAICANLRKEGRVFLRQIGGERVLEGERARRQPPRDYWWWYLDDELDAAQRVSFKRKLRTAGIVAAVLLVAFAVYRIFFTPDPLVIAEVNAQQDADLYLSDGKTTDALQAVETGLQQAPNSALLLIYKGLILEDMGQAQEGASYLEQARQILNDEEIYVLNQAQTLMVMSKFDAAIDLLKQLITKEPNSAKAYLMLGQAYESSGDQASALQAYEDASTIGEAADDSTTVAQARIKMGLLMQVYGMSDYFSTATPTP
jgi:tetratricopeptide (TPR) repeat protein